MIERMSDFPGHVLGFVCSGRVTKADYETVLLPTVESALRQQEKVRLYYEIALDFSHIEPGVSHNFNLGMEHLLRWDRIAIVTNIDWIREAIRAFSFLMPGAVEIFLLDEAAKAREWILATDAA
jgi:SpoIIAA-like